MTRDEVLKFLADRQSAWEARDPAALAGFIIRKAPSESPIFGTVTRSRRASKSRTASCSTCSRIGR